MQATPDEITDIVDTDVSHAEVAAAGRADVAAAPGGSGAARPSTGQAKGEEASSEPGAVSPARNWMLPLAVVVIGMFMSVLDTSIVNVAIPTMQKEFNVTSNDIEWVSTAYTLCLGVVVPTSAWLGERIGLRRLYLITLLGFAGFSAMCGLSGNLGVLIFFRVLQAVPAGVIPVTCLTILYRMVPREQLGTAMGLYGFGLVVRPASARCWAATWSSTSTGG
jgi:MFS family permease